MQNKITIPGRVGVATGNVIAAQRIVESLIEKTEKKNRKYEFQYGLNELSTKLTTALNILNTLYAPEGQCSADKILLKY